MIRVLVYSRFDIKNRFENEKGEELEKVGDDLYWNITKKKIEKHYKEKEDEIIIL